LDLLRKDRLIKPKKKNCGNNKLTKAIDKMIADIEKADWNNRNELLHDRPDADKIHGDNFFFFDINVHRTMIMVLFHENEAEVLWVGNHDQYDLTFKGNKKTIETWIRNQGKIK
jgi:mRNA-degrading endonuclease HigB of HigAB toxin-antitoxin module